jgi:hypothetical protein
MSCESICSVTCSPNHRSPALWSHATIFLFRGTPYRYPIQHTSLRCENCLDGQRKGKGTCHWMQSDVCRQQRHQSLRRTIRHNVTPCQFFCATCFDIRREKNDGEIRVHWYIRAQMLCRGKIVCVCKHNFTKLSFKIVNSCWRYCEHSAANAANFSVQSVRRFNILCMVFFVVFCFECILFSFIIPIYYFLFFTFCLLLHFQFVLFCTLLITSFPLIYLRVL